MQLKLDIFFFRFTCTIYRYNVLCIVCILNIHCMHTKTHTQYTERKKLHFKAVKTYSKHSSVFAHSTEHIRAFTTQKSALACGPLRLAMREFITCPLSSRQQGDTTKSIQHKQQISIVPANTSNPCLSTNRYINLIMHHTKAII